MNNNNKKETHQPSKVQHLWQLYFEKNYQKLLEGISKKFVDDCVPEMLHISGLAMVVNGKAEMGLPLLKTASMLMPQVINWYANASVVLCEKYPQEAMLFASEGLNHHQYETLYFCKGNALVGMEKYTEARDAFLEGLKLNPKSIEILLNLGNVYRKLDEPGLGFDCYSKILEIEPKNHRAKFNHASYRMAKGEHVEDAKQMCLDYLKIEDSAEVAFMLSLFYLDEGDYENGWKHYARRWESTLTVKDRADFRAPVATTLEEIKDKKICVFHEQGFGDSLQFCRYIPMYENIAKEIWVCVPTPLVRLFKLSFPNVNVTDTRNDAYPYDYEVPLLNSPLIFKTTMETIPNTIPYLKCEKVVKTSAKIGLVWAGHKREDADLAAVDKRRSLFFKIFEDNLLDLPLEFGSLQLGVPAAEAENHLIPKLLNSNFDFLDSANIIKGLDLVITADTAPAHLSAAIDGPEVWMISRKDSCWRWNQEKHKNEGTPNESEWYPNMKIFYQTEKGKWDDVFVEIRKELKKRYGL